MTTNPPPAPQPDWPTHPSPWPGPYPPKPPTVTPLTRSLVAPEPATYPGPGHRLVHPHPLAGCPWCPQEGLSCRWCGLPLDQCLDVAGHAQLDRQAETTWRAA